MTAPRILTTKFARPLEREFEGWIVREIQDYFLQIGQPAAVWAVSPSIEKTWPADEAIAAAGKVFGLQFKQAQLADGTLRYDRLKWSLRQPPGQYKLVQKTREVFYALPTFINRDWSRVSLQHCLFWRPPASVVDYNAWYANPQASTPHNRLAFEAGTLRWGGLVERLVNCDEGRRFERGFNPREYVFQLARASEVASLEQTQSRNDVEVAPQNILYLVYLTL